MTSWTGAPSNVVSEGARMFRFGRESVAYFTIGGGKRTGQQYRTTCGGGPREPTFVLFPPTTQWVRGFGLVNT
eukprot:6135309-Pyramimonas_sp.AAC.1